MSKRLASFNYEDNRYVVTLDDGYLQRSFPGRNAVSINEIQINPGYSAALTQPWGAYRPNMCPVSEDADVVKVGDNFIVHGTCGGHRFELTEMSYEIEEDETPEVEEEPVADKEETPVVEEEFAPSEEAVTPSEEEMHEDEDAAHVLEETLEEAAKLSEELPAEEPITGEMEYAGNESKKRMQIGCTHHSGIKLHTSVVDKRQVPESLIVDPVMRSPEHYRGVRIGVSLEKTANPIRNAQSGAEPYTRKRVVQEKRELFTPTPKQEVEPAPVVEEEPKVEEPVKQDVTFEDAPKPNMNDFDCNEFMSKLSAEQIQFLRQVPECFLGTIHEFTKDPISMDKLKTLGSIYCVNNKWKISGDWYAIDEVQTLSRVIYCATTNEFQRIATKTLKGWKKCLEAGLVG